jgi:hypothetical protein
MTLLQGGAVIATTTTSFAQSTLGMYAFNNVIPGTYTIAVSGSFPTVTSPAFTTVAGTNNTVNLAVASGSGGASTVSGTVTNLQTGLAQTGATVTLLQGTTTLQTTTSSSSGTYSFSNVANGSNYSMTVSSSTNVFPAVTVGPFSVSGNTTENVSVGSGAAGFNVSGTVTNASSGLGQGGATVTLNQGTTVVATTTTSSATATLGMYAFNTIPVGSYTITVSSPTNAFTPVTSAVFTVSGNTTVPTITVGTGVTTGGSVSGTIGSDNPTTDVFTVSILLNGVTVATTTSTAGTATANGPSFTLTNVPAGSGYLIEATSANYPGVITVFGPLTVPATGLTGLAFNNKSVAELASDGVPSTANLVAYPATGSTTGVVLAVNSQTSTNGNPAFLSNVPTVSVTAQCNTTVTLTDVPMISGDVTVLRLSPTADQ